MIKSHKLQVSYTIMKLTNGSYYPILLIREYRKSVPGICIDTVKLKCRKFKIIYS